MLQGEPKEIKATINGAGVEAVIVLRTPNNKNIEDLRTLKVFKKLEELQGTKIDDLLFVKLKELKAEIDAYQEEFFTYESVPALSMEIYDYRDRVKRC